MPDLHRGIVTKTKAMAKTITVTITRRFEHPKYIKQLTRTHKMLVHDEHEIARPGDRATIIHGAPFSKRKHFRLHELSRDGKKVDLSASRPPASTVDAEAMTDAGAAVPVEGGQVIEALRESKGGPQMLRSL